MVEGAGEQGGKLRKSTRKEDLWIVRAEENGKVLMTLFRHQMSHRRVQFPASHSHFTQKHRIPL